MITEISKADALVEQYEEQGYLHVKGILSDTLVARLADVMYGELAVQSEAFYQETGTRLEDAGAVRQYLEAHAQDTAWFSSLQRSTQHLIKGEFPLEVRLREEFVGVTAERELTDQLRALLGGAGLRMHYPPMLRFKVPNMDQAQVPLHQDAPYFAHLATFANVWIPLCPITPECGGVNVLEGSHKLGALEHSQSVIWGSYVSRESVGDRFPDKHILTELGDVLIFGPHLLHYTHSNTSERIRCSIDSRWFNGETDTTRQYYDVDAREVVKLF